jgi:opacity protein-like surface antigen
MNAYQLDTSLHRAGLLLVLCLATPAYAADLFLDARAGSATVDSDPNADNIYGGVDMSSTGFQVGIGYELTEVWSVTLSYHDLGDDSGIVPGFQCSTPTPPVDCSTYTLPQTWDATGVSVAARYRYDLEGQWHIFGELGIMQWEVDSARAALAESASESALLYGVGIAFEVSDSVDLAAQYSAAGSDVGLLTVGVRIGF